MNDRPLSPQAQHLKANWTPDRIADELHRVTNGGTDWRTPERKLAAPGGPDWNNSRVPSSADRAYGQELTAAMGRHPSGGGSSGLTPAAGVGASASKPVRHHPPRIK